MSSTSPGLPSSRLRPTIPVVILDDRLLSRNARLLPCITLGLALFLAQTGALLHSSGHAGDPQNHSRLHSQLCDACLSFSTIFSMAGGPGTVSVVPPAIVAFLAVSAIVSLVERAVPRAFRSRAPPRQ